MVLSLWAHTMMAATLYGAVQTRLSPRIPQPLLMVMNKKEIGWTCRSSLGDELMEPNFLLFGKITWNMTRNEINMVNNFINVYFIASWGLKLDLKNQNFYMISILYIFQVHSLARLSATLIGKQQNCEYWCTVCFICNRNWLGDEGKRKWNWITVFCRDPFIIFAGGMPRASYGDRHTVTIMQGANNIHTVLDFTSKVVDFVTISRADETEDEMGKWREWL